MFSTSSDEWSAALASLLPSIHEVDRAATWIWFHFHPLPLAETLVSTDDRARLVHRLRLAGIYDLAALRDSSHWFLYGHRYWPDVRRAIVRWRQEGKPETNGSLTDIASRLSQQLAQDLAVEASLTAGITFAGLMTLRQAGDAAFCEGETAIDELPPPKSTPEELVAARRRDDSQGLFGFLRGQRTRFSVRFDERRANATFALISQQDLTTAASTDSRDYTRGPRPAREGPIPTDCRSASCGTCWVGILGGREKLSEVEPLEARRLRDFGYCSSSDPKPSIRLACMARASGNVTIVIPTWNGVIGKVVNPSRRSSEAMHEGADL